jgi:hypothetical protein
MVKVFISYRRDDAGWAGRIEQTLESRPNIEAFLDVEDIPVGEDFPVRLLDELDQSDIVIALIASSWVARAKDLNQETDWIRRELKYALEQQKIVMPVLIEDVRIPDLPEQLNALQTRNGMTIRNSNYKSDIANLIKEILRMAKEESNRRVTARKSGLRSVLNLATRRISKATSPNDRQLDELEQWLQPFLTDIQEEKFPEYLKKNRFSVSEPIVNLRMRGISYKAVKIKEKLRLQIGMSQHSTSRNVIMVYDVLDNNGNGRTIIVIFDHFSSIGDDILKILNEPKSIPTDEYRLPYVSVFFSPIKSDKRYSQTYYPYFISNGKYNKKGIDSDIFVTLFDLIWLGSIEYTKEKLQGIHDEIHDKFNNYQIIHASEFPNNGI